ncbi:MAG: 1-phosphofructokinase family hexose kinase [Propionibacteriaceae bacterium]|jgi:1-phosphofructokinase|nr:1-phosphofructokinase family hexose kinase [Propionibacteriaceae bacterium]
MIITVTVNPAMDKTAEVGRLAPGGLNRLDKLVVDVGGKGVNVSKTIAALGGRTLATGFLGGSAGREIDQVLAATSGIETDFVTIAAPTRTNLKVLTSAEGITEFNEPGPVVSVSEVAALTTRLTGLAWEGVIFVMAGSLPGGVGQDLYAQLIDAVTSKGAAVFLDADGEAFRQAISAKPTFVKPNRFELTQYFGAPQDLALADCVVLCRRLIDQGIKLVTCSLGADGAIFVSADQALHCPGLDITPASTVGAGDAMVAGLVHAFSQGEDLRQGARLAMAVSAGACLTRGTQPPDRATIESLLPHVTFTQLQ